MSGLISRQAAIEALNVKCMMPVWCKVLVKKMLKDLPSAQPERKKGKWIDGTATHIKTGEERAVRRCSQCGAGYFRYDISENTDPAIPNFCPNCGSDNRGDKDEAD